MRGEALKGHLDLILLAALDGVGSAHGYEIQRLLRTTSQGSLDLAEGTIYPALHRLEHAGWVDSEWSRNPTSGRKRRVYTLTTSGRDELRLLAEQWRDGAAALDAILETAPTTD